MSRFLPCAVLLILFQVGALSPVKGQGCNLETTAVIGFACSAVTTVGYENGIDCYSEMRMILEQGTFYTWTANVGGGWIVEQLAPNELLVTHINGIFPSGKQTLVDFLYYTPGGVPTQLILLYPDECVLEGCENQHTLPGCGEGCISGSVYRECADEPLTDQPTVDGFLVELTDDLGNIVAEYTTDIDGAYSLCDLPPGNYIVRATKDPGWTSSVPATGMYAFELLPGSELFRNFGSCPECTCDDYEVFLHQEPGNGDTSYLNITVAKNNPFCWEQYEISIDSGEIVQVEILSNGLEGQIINGQHATLTRTGINNITIGVVWARLTINHYGIKEKGIKSFLITNGDGNQPPEPTCLDSIILEHPSRYKAPTCCPDGYLSGPELVVDGHFAGPGFPATDYTPWVSGIFNFGHVAILDQASAYAINNSWVCPGFTNIWDTYLAVDGGLTTHAAWKQQVSGITPNGEYQFCTLVSNLISSLKNFVDPEIILEIVDDTNPSIIWSTPPLILPENPKQWVEHSLAWTAPSSPASSYTLRIRSNVQVTVGNDFALDRISFRECTLAPQDTCCKDLQAFCDDLEAGIIFSSDSCKITMNLSALPPCYTIEWVNWGQGPEFGPWTPSTFPYPMHTFSGNGTYPISYLAIAYNDSNFICLEKLMTDTITVQCDPCICNMPNMSITTNLESFQLFCFQGLPTPSLPCPASDVVITGFFGCETASGALCEETTVNYVLTGPNGIIDQGTTTPFPSLTFTVSQIGTPGTYMLTLSTLCPGQTDSCVCTVRWVQEACDTCFCGGFEDMFVRTPQGAMNMAVACGDPPLIIPCPQPGKGFHFTGVFGCVGGACPPIHQIDWSLEHQSSGTTHSGSFQDNDPFFGIYILPSYISQPGIYTLTLTGHCNGDTCVCEVQFIIDCPDLCPCDIDDIIALSNNVNMGFAVALANKSCKACFSPLAVSDCETVEWYVNNTSGTPIGNSIGSQTFCYTFPFSGTYTIYMVVTRLKPDGTLCEVFVYSKTITVSCIKAPVCDVSVFPNPGFGEGAIGGLMGAGGEAPGWFGEGEHPTVLEGGGADDAWAILLTGCFFNSDVLTSNEPVCLSKTDTGTVTIRLRSASDPIPGVDVKQGRKPPGGNRLHIQFRAKKDPGDKDCGKGEKCRQLAIIEDLLPIEDDDWYDLYIPYDINNWESEDSCGDLSGGLPVHLKVWMSNMLSSDQGDGNVRDGVILDQICMDGTLVSTGNPISQIGYRLFPNPTTGAFRLEFPNPAGPNTRMHISGLTGQVLLDQAIVEGTDIHTVDTGDFSPGMYFIELMQNGKRLAVFRVVRQ